MTPLVSIVLPARDAAATLPACLSSIRRQTLAAWECIIVDDGSTDDTAGLAARMAREDPRIRVVSIPPQGIVGALNRGLAESRAPLVARMDADDLMHRERLAAQLAALDRHPDLAAVGCHVRIVPRAAMSAGLRQYERWLNSLRSDVDVARDVFVECPIAHPTLLMRREMADLGYGERPWAEDYDLLLRAITTGLRVGMVPRRLLLWRDRADSLSRTDERYSIAQFTACKAHYLAAVFLGGRDDYVLWGYGGTGRALRRALAVLGKVPSHIVEVKPTRLGKHIHGAPVIRPERLPALEPRPIVVSVAHEGPRTEIRRDLTAMRFVEGRDYVCAA